MKVPMNYEPSLALKHYWVSQLSCVAGRPKRLEGINKGEEA